MSAEVELPERSQGPRTVDHGRVLVVDDEPLVCWSVSETLADAGYEVVEAFDGASAIQVFSLAAHDPDIVLLDLQLPDYTDLHLFSTLHQLSPRTPVVIITAHASPEVRDEAKRLGVVAIIDKPVDMSALPPLVARVLASRLQ